ncbi:MAG: hypothetical protein HQ574_01640 [Chloroflexi bacterium]|nr:hypothetical protein [Chloroflexota bacterium]
MRTPSYDHHPLTTMTSLTINKIIKRVDIIQDMMSLSKILSASQNECSYCNLEEDISSTITDAANTVEKILQDREKNTADLTIRSRRAHQWVNFLSNKENLADHLDALQRVNLFLSQIRNKLRVKRKRIDFKFYHLGSLYKIQEKPSDLLVSVQESFITAPDQILIALLETALGTSSKETRLLIRDYTFSPSYQATRETLEYLGIPQDSFSKGSVHDLSASFRRVNQTYFNGKFSKPHLIWNNRLTHRKFGHYQWDTDTVMVSSSLDHKRVPNYVVDFVMYHELLHKKLGSHRVHTKRVAHTRKFREAEHLYVQFDEAQQKLNQLARKYS